MHSFNKCLLATYHVPSTILKEGGKAMKKVLPVLKKLSSNGELENTHTHLLRVEKARVFSVQPRARLGLIQLRAHPRSQLQYPIAQMRTPRLRENQSFGSLCPPSGLWLGSSGGGGPRGGQARLVPLFSIPRRRLGALGCAVHPSSFLPASPKDLVMRSVP